MKDFRSADTHPFALHPEPRPISDPAKVTSLASFELVYRELFAFVWRSLRGLGVQLAALDDATQDVFLVVHRQLPHFEQRASLRTWVFGIAYNVASNYRRQEHRKGGLMPMDPATPSSTPDPEDELRRTQAWWFVSRFLEQLDEQKRAVFVLTQLEGMSAVEVAEALAIPVNTVYTRLHHARVAFRDALAKRETGELQ